jgi:putative nucleotidyltransferase with HDIG domain
MDLSRDKALTRLKEHVKNEKTFIHCLASEAVMHALALHLGEDEDRWGLTGLLHDIDVEVTNADPKVHALKAEELLSGLGLDEEMLDAIRMHNDEATGIPRSTRFQHALSAGETITGLIYATTLVYPDKKIASVKYKSIRKRMREKAFAASVNRDHIMECEKIGIPLDEFIQISVDAMRGISASIGL